MQSINARSVFLHCDIASDISHDPHHSNRLIIPSSMGSLSVEPLLHLLAAPSAKVAEQIFQEVWKNRAGAIAPLLLESLVAALKLTEQQATEVRSYALVSNTGTSWSHR